MKNLFKDHTVVITLGLLAVGLTITGLGLMAYTANLSGYANLTVTAGALGLMMCAVRLLLAIRVRVQW